MKSFGFFGLFLVLLELSILVLGRKPCVARTYGHDSIVCVCNSNHCDDLDLDPTTKTEPGLVLEVESSLAGRRFQTSELRFQQDSETCAESSHGRITPDKTFKLTLTRSKTYQSIIGFGGAFTDAAGLVIKSLPPPLADRLVQDYYGADGIQYSLGRVPIGGTDFSTRPYSYNDLNASSIGSETDFNLTHWKLQPEDFKYKIPIIKLALEKSSAVSNSTHGVKLFGSPWSAPAWMKTTGKLNGGKLLGVPGSGYYDAWAQYFVKFFTAYRQHGIDFWGLTVQNEPTDGSMPFFPFNAMGWSATDYRNFIRLSLGPALDRAGFNPKEKDGLKIMIWDDTRTFMENFVNKVMESEGGYVSGFAVHWYYPLASRKLFDRLAAKFPDKFILGTEACANYLPFPWIKHVQLGAWSNAESYAKDIMQDLQHAVGGWTDWNLALDTAGGPNWVNNMVDAPIIVNATAGEYYKQTHYYALGHFSKFLPPGSRRIDLGIAGRTFWDKSLDGVAFVTPYNATVLVLHNYDSTRTHQLEIPDGKLGTLTLTIGPKTIKTLQWYN